MMEAVNLVIFASRESAETLHRTLSCAVNAVTEGSSIDVLINGNELLAGEAQHWVGRNFASLEPCPRIWSISASDKGNAWNRHIHDIWQGDRHAIYVDGYVRINPAAIEDMMETLSHDGVLGTSAMPSTGPSARHLRNTMREQGGFHGNLCAISSTALHLMQNRNIRIPIGMYRVDSIMGAFLSFGLDNTENAWNPFKFIPLSPTATWECDAKKWYRPGDVLAWYKRRKRQAKGRIENAAVRYHLAELKCLPEALPGNVRELFRAWRKARPDEVLKVGGSANSHENVLRQILDYVEPKPNELLARRVGT